MAQENEASAPDKQIRQIQGLMRITGDYKGPVNGVSDKATTDGMTKFLKDRQIDLSQTPKDKLNGAVIEQLRAEVSTSPRSVATMQALKNEGTPDSISAMQYGLQTYGTPVEATGRLGNSGAALDAIAKQQESAQKVGRPAAPAGNASRPGYDADIEKAQGYMRMFGISEVEVNGQKKELGVDGINGPITSAALTKYKADNGLGNEDDFASVLRHMEERAKKNGPDLQERMRQTAAQGASANPNNVMGMQMILNLLAPIISALTGGKINLQQLAVDGKNGPLTSTAAGHYQTASPQIAQPAKPVAAPAAAPGQSSGAATPTRAEPATAAPAQPAVPAAVAPATAATPPQADAAREQGLKTELGMNDEEWAVLKKAQLEWEDRANKGQEVSKISPLAREQLKLAQANEPALEAGQKPRADEVIMKEKGIDPLATMGPRGKIYAEQGPNGGVVFVQQPAPQAAPATAAPAQAAPAQASPAAAIVPNRDPNASLAERAAFRQQQVSTYMQQRGLSEQQANFQVTRDRYQELRGAGLSSADMSRMISEERQFATQKQEARPGYQRGQFMPSAVDPLAQQYNGQASRTLPSLDERMEARAERIKMYVDRGMPLRDASRTVGQERTREMEAQGYDRNTVRSVVGAENKIEETQIKQIEAQQKAAVKAERTAVRNQGAADRENERDGRTLGGVAADFGGLKGRDKQLATAMGGILGRVGGAVIGDSAPSDSGDKERGRYAREIGNAAGGGPTGRLAEVLFRRGGDVVTYPQQSAREGYAAQPLLGNRGNFSLEESGQASRRLNGAAQDGVTSEDRAKIIADYEAQKAAAPIAVQPPQSTNQRQYSGDMNSP